MSDYLFALPASPRYREGIDRASRTDLDDPVPSDEEEDEETLASTKEGIRHAEAGRTVPIEEVRRLLPKWITASSSPTER
jgi:predicted transcriptional regulator